MWQIFWQSILNQNAILVKNLIEQQFLSVCWNNCRRIFKSIVCLHWMIFEVSSDWCSSLFVSNSQINLRIWHFIIICIFFVSNLNRNLQNRNKSIYILFSIFGISFVLIENNSLLVYLNRREIFPLFIIRRQIFFCKFSNFQKSVSFTFCIINIIFFTRLQSCIFCLYKTGFRCTWHSNLCVSCKIVVYILIIQNTIFRNSINITACCFSTWKFVWRHNIQVCVWISIDIQIASISDFYTIEIRTCVEHRTWNIFIKIVCQIKINYSWFHNIQNTCQSDCCKPSPLHCQVSVYINCQNRRWCRSDVYILTSQNKWIERGVWSNKIQ